MATQAATDVATDVKVEIEPEVAKPSEAIADVKVEIQPEATNPSEKAKAGKSDQKVAPTKDYRAPDARPDYHVVCCENSWGDIFFIPFQTLLLYGFMIGFSILVVQGTYMSTISQAALWIYFFAWAAGVVYLSVTIATADWETSLKAKLAAKMAADEGAVIE
ncbi:hypothetical protein SPRG_07819 [Saprolegnia parasitica CBS 223.65]|uniref:Uncharacterized protein n=1 Tax=Saprolegnia parasitica (strain CBS 223.65) TaxID=695850 RepID=A0A067C9D1_SAPPC|nr:hypothetical protein SPRG_07819 [Saprolegnia parasitica CBS 223.65]KDO27108.1 hypothetical protein SPRG_07819 [Saprolegnia parasitica CBS 223.65]|eukprot:XP_012202201.1 hypothetical protein SPRG_07819 [Saprolegnia parasitica CBS 223.65]